MMASQCGAIVFRNNTGALKDGTGRTVTFGLCKGGSDLIGWTKDGRFLAMEVKIPGKKPSTEQLIFINNVIKAGGVAGVVFSANDVKLLLDML